MLFCHTHCLHNPSLSVLYVTHYFPNTCTHATFCACKIRSASFWMNLQPLLQQRRKKYSQLCVCIFGCFSVVGIAQWLERWTCDWKVARSNSCRSSGRFFSPGSIFWCWFLFRYLFHPCVTTVAHKRPKSLCQKRRWQVTAKYACTLHVVLHKVKWFMVVWGTQNLSLIHISEPTRPP